MLIVVHQILIASAVGLALIFSARSAVVFTRTGASEDILTAVASALVAGLLAIYLRRVRAKVKAGAGRGAPSPS